MGRAGIGTPGYTVYKVTHGYEVTKKFVLEELLDLYRLLMADRDLIFPEDVLENKHYTYKELVEWSKEYMDDYPEISKITKKIQEILLGRVKKGVVSNKIPSTFIKFILTTEFGYTEKSETIVQHTMDSEISQDKRELLNNLFGGREEIKE